MEYFTQQLINGVSLGSIYGLIAIGYTMVYGIIGMVNFAHGDVLMIGAMAGLSILKLLETLAPGLPGMVQLIIAILGAIPICIAVNSSLQFIIIGVSADNKERTSGLSLVILLKP